MYEVCAYEQSLIEPNIIRKVTYNESDLKSMPIFDGLFNFEWDAMDGGYGL